MGARSAERQISDLGEVLRITRAMAGETDLDGLLSLIVDRGVGLLSAERGTLWLYDGGAHELFSRVATGVEQLRIPADAGLAGAAVAEGRTIVVHDAYADSRFNPDVDRSTGFRTRNILSTPLRGLEGQLVGVLQVLNKQDGDFGDYDIQLAETLAAQAGVAIQRAELIRHYVQKQQMVRSLEIAREIQQKLLPEAPPTCPTFDVAGFSVPADRTGGDTFDYLPVDAGRCMVSVADATGHGVGPAILAAETRAMLRAMGLQQHDVGVILRTVNDLLAGDLDGGRFVTCFLGLLDGEAGRLTFSSAGHGPILHYRRAADEYDEYSGMGLPLGVLSGTEYDRSCELDFEPGDLFAVTTDGVFEAADPHGEQFGIDRLKNLLRDGRDRPAVEILDTLQREVCRFTGYRPQMDDVTAVLIRRLDGASQA